MAQICPRCGTVNQANRSTCVRCGAELASGSFAGMFGPPERIKGRYAIERTLKRGAKLSLYAAVDLGDENRPCLVHQVSLADVELNRRELIEYRFLQEAAAWQGRRHPNIIRILDADVQTHRLYLVTEHIRGTSLRSIIRDREHPIPEPMLSHWAQQICDALQFLHRLEPPVVLGCLSPSVIHVTDSGGVQLIEVGLVRYQRSGLIGDAKGVPGYAAPEQRRGIVIPRSDLYTVGIILYELITGLDPQHRPLPSLLQYGSGFSESFRRAVARAYRRDPEKRFASAREMGQALAGASTQMTVRLPPFELREGLTSETVPELVQLCATHWEDGLAAWISGRIVDWLHSATQVLRQEGQGQAAQGLEETARQTAAALDRIVALSEKPSTAGAALDVAQNAAYADWLQQMGAVGIQPDLEVHPTHIDFGTVGATVRATTTLQVHNKGQGYLSGRVESPLNWLTIPGPVFGCRAGETAQIGVIARGRLLPSGGSSSDQAIRVSSTGGETWIAAQAQASPPILGLGPRSLYFGAITRGASRVVYLTVTNEGGGRLSGRVIPRAPWLRVRQPEFSCPAGSSVEILVELLSDRLPAGAIRIRRALAVDSDSGQAQVDVSWKWARPALELDTAGLDLGTVQRGERVRRRLILSNSGTADLVGEARSTVDWLTVDPGQFRCPPGEQQELKVECLTENMLGGSTVEAEALVIEANAGTQVLSVSVEVLAPRLTLEPAEIDLGLATDDDQVEETVTIGNRGSLAWEGRVEVNVPWLKVEPQEIRCEPGHSIPVAVMLESAAIQAGGEWADSRALEIGTGRDARPVAVRVFLSRPQLHVERRSLPFGLIGRTDVVSLPLEVTNKGTGELEWRIAVRGTWLEVIPESGTCSDGETQTIQVNAYALAVDGDSDQAWLTVRSNGGRVDLPASVALSSPQLSVEPLLIDMHSENYAPVAQQIRIANRGVGELRGTVQARVPWLSITPPTFVCDTGISREIQVHADVEALREGRYHAIDALIVESNGGNEAVEATLILTLRPELQVLTPTLRLENGTQTLELTNAGHGSLRVQVIPEEEWIVVNRRDWTIKAGRKARVKISVLDPPRDVVGSVKVRTPEETIWVSVEPGEPPAQKTPEG